MTDKILIDRAVVQQVLEAFEIHAKQYPHMVKGYTLDAEEALRAALEQPDHSEQRLDMVPQGEQEPVAWMTEDGRIAIDATKQWGIASTTKSNFNIPLYTHPQNLRCKSTQARLATLWGCVKEQPPRQPLTREEIAFIAAACGGLASDFVVSVARAIEAAHGVKGRK